MQKFEMGHESSDTIVQKLFFHLYILIQLKYY